MIVAGGGTGGHLFPGLAVAEWLANGAAEAVLFVGSAFGLEARMIPQTRFDFRAIRIRGLRGRGWLGAVELAGQLPVAIVRGWRIIGEFRSQVVLGVGGYASFPVVVAAWLRGVPSILLEQNARPGLANRVLGRLARRVCTTFSETNQYFPAGKAIVTGNPVRPLVAPTIRRGNGFTVLVFGGSQGARRLNQAMSMAAPILQAAIPDLQLVHQTGPHDRERLQDHYANLGLTAEVREFIDDMGWAYHQADLVVCRAGATTVAELTMLGKAAILVPYPYAADDHQRANAQVLAEREAAELLLDQEATGERLAAIIIELAADRQRLAAIGIAAGRLAVPDAAARVARICREIAGEGEVDG